MSDFRTSISIKPAKNQIDYNSKILLIGSCFSNNISDKLSYYKFINYINPYGILYNPLAIEKSISEIISLKKYDSSNLIYQNGLWHSLNHHSSFSNINKKNVLVRINNNIVKSNLFIKNASHIIITLGTSWAYRLIESDNVVGNCHKIPQKKFNKELISVKEIITRLESIITKIKSINKDADFIFTVSPIRHLRDGFTENQISKSHLIIAINQLIYKQQDSSYFPSYEIMNDDLRDYRFYKEDMVHPNKIALDYIWNKFKETWIDKNCWNTLKQINTIQKKLNHKPFNEHSEQHKLFLKSLIKDINNIQSQYPFISFKS